MKGWKITLAVLLLVFGLALAGIGVTTIYLVDRIRSIYETDPQIDEQVGQRIREAKGESAYDEWIKFINETERQTTEGVKQLDELTSSLQIVAIMLMIVGLIYITFFIMLLLKPLPIVALVSGIYALISLVPLLAQNSLGVIIQISVPILIFIVSLITFLTKKAPQNKNTAPNINPN